MKAVIFDWGGVIENTSDSENGWYKLTSNIISRLTNGKINELRSWATFSLDDKKVNICSINDMGSLSKWVEYLEEEYGFKTTIDEFISIYKEEYDKSLYYKDVVDYIHSLKGKCRVGILSNLVMLDKDRLNKQVDFSYIDDLFLSFEVGLIKPNEGIFERVEESLKIPSKDILFIDDRKDNVDAALNRGWNALQATGEDLEKIKEVVNNFIER